MHNSLTDMFTRLITQCLPDHRRAMTTALVPEDYNLENLFWRFKTGAESLGMTGAQDLQQTHQAIAACHAVPQVSPPNIIVQLV